MMYIILSFLSNLIICTSVRFLGLLLLLRSPAIFLGFTNLGEIFAYMTFFFNPIIEVVTFRLRGYSYV